MNNKIIELETEIDELNVEYDEHLKIRELKDKRNELQKNIRNIKNQNKIHVSLFRLIINLFKKLFFRIGKLFDR